MKINTADLRLGAQPRWARARDHLQAAGVDPRRAVVAMLRPDDGSRETCLILAGNGRVFAFAFDYLCDEQGNELDYQDARVTDWAELQTVGLDTTERYLVPASEYLTSESPAGN